MVKFIPKFKDRSLLDTNCNEFIVDADVTIKNKNSFQEIATQIPNYVINPVTSRFPYSSTKTSEKLPYFFSKNEFAKILSNSSERLKKLIIPCVKFLLETNSKNVIPPYFYAEDITSQTFNVNLENIANVIKFKEKENVQFSIYPVINVSSNILTNDNSIRYVASMYMSDEYYENISGYYILIDEFDANKADPSTLIGYLKLIKALSKKEVHLLNINSFGYIGLLAGATSFSSGLASGESSSVNNWISDDNQNAPRQRPPKFIYVPEIFSYIDEIELQKANYTCNCSHCNGTLPSTTISKKKHFLACRQRDIKNNFSGEFDSDLLAWENVFSEALSYANNLLSLKKTTRSYSTLVTPINKWNSILPVLKDLKSLEENEDLLAQILNEIDETND
ncbi:MAG: hypothetical protein QY312_00275 [Candidatus Dojkabacteria bacterium]|nr:MAG: hypothetical protein QY312_00275 [Candidatus Dojkabacteria bacterium]